MKKTLMLVYAVCAMLLISGCFLWFVFTLRADSLTGKIESMNVFKTFTRQASEIIRNAQYDENINISQALEQLCRNNSAAIPAVQIRTEHAKLFSWPPASSFFPSDQETVKVSESLPLFCTRAQTTVPATAYSEALVVQGILQTVSTHTLFNRGQTVFFITLTLSLFTLVLLIFSYIDTASDKPEPDGEVYTSDRDSSADEDTELEIPPLSVEESDTVSASSNSLTEQLESLNRLHICNTDSYNQEHKDDNNTPFHNDTVEEAQHIREESPHENTVETSEYAAATSFTDESYQPEAADSVESAAALPAAAHESPAEHQPDQPPISAENYGSFEHSLTPEPIDKRNTASYGDSGQAGMYSPDCAVFSADAAQTHAKIIEDLQTAIRETAVAEEDLTLLFIRMPEIAHNESIIQSVKTGLDRINKLFFFDENTIGLIIYYTTLDNAMRIAVKLYEDINSLLLFSDCSLPLGIGLTTRAGRLIPAYRMIEEAGAAIKKTMEPNSDPIVAFRVNPEEYRRCLTQMAEIGAK